MSAEGQSREFAVGGESNCILSGSNIMQAFLGISKLEDAETGRVVADAEANARTQDERTNGRTHGCWGMRGREGEGDGMAGVCIYGSGCGGTHERTNTMDARTRNCT